MAAAFNEAGILALQGGEESTSVDLDLSRLTEQLFKTSTDTRIWPPVWWHFRWFKRRGKSWMGGYEQATASETSGDQMELRNRKEQPTTDDEARN